jgi:hypothetical protein
MLTDMDLRESDGMVWSRVQPDEESKRPSFAGENYSTIERERLLAHEAKKRSRYNHESGTQMFPIASPR